MNKKQTRSQFVYGVRRTWANKLERQAAAVRAGDWDLADKLETELAEWADRKYNQLIATGA